ncbi:thiamine pyrophosphate-binding protein [Tsukamurella sp. 8F]|uniref:thiamine pyrophosphate-binding protein n=1 Tax=unclassified Tsukamurella TaxID=2633480 RepID=UPI0023B9CBD1|nr:MULTISPECIES: thiamine pyrophosphate-binding protein [unclassified Tsukamurella]MDF0529522.1 thiamine pyrophosphate-binding protein [Tsukamurella sp. 8J]MDF0585790.1 thiamine pyrophosphate-binding protein [Tsukamurella sp. 8F]
MAALVADRIVDSLYAYGIHSVFGVHGANSEDLFAAALTSAPYRAGDLSVTVAKHEFGAGAMADGAARMTGAPAALVTTSGGGAMNAVPALAESYESRVPVLAVIGSAPRPGEGRGGFQDMCTAPLTIDAPAVFRGVTGFSARVTSPEMLEPALDGARAALERGLPAALLVPKDVQQSPATSPVPTTRGARPDPVVPPEVVELLARARRPLLLLGEAASRARLGTTLAPLLAATGAVVATTPNGRDACPANAVFVGVSGVMGHPSTARAAAEADAIVVLGGRLSATDRAGLDPYLDRAVHIDADPPLRPVALHVQAQDLSAWTTALVKAVAEATARVCRPWTDAAPEPLRPEQPADIGTTCADAVAAVATALPPEALVFADAGNAGAAAVHRIPVSAGHRFLVALGMGGMGYGIAAAVGASIATRRRAVVVAGDGAFYMHGMELHTAVQYDAPVTLVVLNNDAHGMCVTRENRFQPGVPGVNTFRHTDIGAGLAAMFPSLTVRTASTPEGAATAARDLLDGRTGPNVLVVDTDPREIPPFAPLLPQEVS